MDFQSPKRNTAKRFFTVGRFGDVRPGIFEGASARRFPAALRASGFANHVQLAYGYC